MKVSKNKIEFIVIIFFIFSCLLEVKYLSNALSIAVIIIFNKEAYTKAKKSVRKCLKFLLVNTVLISISIAGVIDLYGINVTENAMLFIFSISYFLIWIISINFIDIEVSKLSTIIIAQIGTVLFIISTYLLNVIPESTINLIASKYPEIKILATEDFSIKELLNISLQTLFYPTIIIATTTYVIAECRGYCAIKYGVGYFSIKNNIVRIFRKFF